MEEHGVQVRKFPDEVLRKLREISSQVLAEEAAKDPLSRKFMILLKPLISKWLTGTGFLSRRILRLGKSINRLLYSVECQDNLQTDSLPIIYIPHRSLILIEMVIMACAY